MPGQASKFATCQKTSRKAFDCRRGRLAGRTFCSAARTSEPTKETGHGFRAIPTQRDAAQARARSQQVGERPVSASAGDVPALRLQQQVPAELTQRSI